MISHCLKRFINTLRFKLTLFVRAKVPGISLVRMVTGITAGFFKGGL